jgi:hypothetical protein
VLISLRNREPKELSGLIFKETLDGVARFLTLSFSTSQSYLGYCATYDIFRGRLLQIYANSSLTGHLFFNRDRARILIVSVLYIHFSKAKFAVFSCEKSFKVTLSQADAKNTLSLY